MEELIKYIRICPEGTQLQTLSPSEIKGLLLASRENDNYFLERCVLAVLYSGRETDDVRSILEKYSEFRIEVIRTTGGFELELHNVPGNAFVTYEEKNGGRTDVRIEMIEGVRQHIFAVIRDLVFVQSEIERTGKYDLKSSKGITDSVFLILRNAGIFNNLERHNMIVCWGGHAISSKEYNYSKKVGYELGLRGMDVITGCGAGAMKGPMKGAAIAHAKQRIKNARYIGITEPGIISSEPPNAIVDPLVIMPDIEMRLEAFVRLGYGIIIFPGGVGTSEELMYILGILSHSGNRHIPFPIILTGPKESVEYFKKLDIFLKNTLGEKVIGKYQIIVDDAEKVAVAMNSGFQKVKEFRDKTDDSIYFNRNLHIPYIFQEKFSVSHEEAEKLNVTREQDISTFAASLRRVFSAIVWGNVKPKGAKAVAEKGPLRIHGEKCIMNEIDSFLTSLAEQKRLRITGEYKQCYEIVK